MGTAHINIYPHLIPKLEALGVSICTQSDFGDGTLFCLVESPLLNGYQGQMFAVLEHDTVSFRPDLDT